MTLRGGHEALDEKERAAIPAKYGDVLIAADLVADRTGECRGLIVRGPQGLPGHRIQCQELSVARSLEHEPAGGRQGPAIPRPASVRTPDLALRHRIPREEHAR